MLTEAARTHGFTHFRATYLAGKKPVAELLDGAGARRSITEGMADAVVELVRTE
ncbi:hypothetical protein [Prauserella flavalba]|uniref:hypothetical protein n=1 Tax=Prauserella flavalba TaxID=1477506 RepID=UPI001FE97593|nr:hypothetical protein [Prauserella flavalba]